jgi:hypothetical protein
MKVVAAYLGLAFGAAEAALLLTPGLSGSEVAVRGALGALVLGFPVAVVLAWTYDITSDGVVRTPDEGESGVQSGSERRSWIVLAVGGLLAGIVLEFLR